MATFEDSFTELQADLISAFMEYIADQAQTLYIYLYQDPEMLTANAFLKKDNCVLWHNEVLGDQAQDDLFEYSVKIIQKLKKLCDENGHPCPTECKLTYQIDTHQFDAEYRYKPYSETEFPDNVIDDWFDALSGSCID